MEAEYGKTIGLQGRIRSSMLKPAVTQEVPFSFLFPALQPLFDLPSNARVVGTHSCIFSLPIVLQFSEHRVLICIIVIVKFKYIFTLLTSLNL